MKIDAIVYTSNTGYTKQYAKMISEKTGIRLYNLLDAKKILPKGANIIYLGWLMASMVKDYSKAAKNFNIKAVCGVCLGNTGSQIDAVKKINKLPHALPVFTLQGGYDHDKVKGIYKFMMDMLTKALSKKQNRAPDEDAMLKLILQGGSFVSEENLCDFMLWFEQNCQA
ncbi:MAG: hypothetical protein IJ424_01875 [Oscillospiraceae bacterium]|nr:hypothetical protein [Oscillospiraceae bacterium]